MQYVFPFGGEYLRDDATGEPAVLHAQEMAQSRRIADPIWNLIIGFPFTINDIKILCTSRGYSKLGWFYVMVDWVNLLEQEKGTDNSGRLPFNLKRVNRAILDDPGGCHVARLVVFCFSSAIQRQEQTVYL